MTPLTRHINEIRQYIRGRADALRTTGRQVVVVIATDGLPSNDMGRSTADSKQEFIRALQSLHGLPVHLVVRLCTDDDEIGEFWNDMDNILELPLVRAYGVACVCVSVCLSLSPCPSRDLSLRFFHPRA